MLTIDWFYCFRKLTLVENCIPIYIYSGKYWKPCLIVDNLLEIIIYIPYIFNIFLLIADTKTILYLLNTKVCVLILKKSICLKLSIVVYIRLVLIVGSTCDEKLR